MNPYAEAAGALAEDERSATRASLYGATAGTPDAAAGALKLGRQAGLPLDVVQRNLPAVQRQVTTNRVETDTERAPLLRNRYADPAFAAVAHDDSANLARLEQTTKAYTFGNALRKGAAGAKLTLDFLADQLAGAFGADRTETQRILQDTARYYVGQGSDPQLQAAGERAKTAGAGTWYGTLLHLPGEVAASDDPFGVMGRFVTEQLPASLAGFGLGAAMTAPARAAIVSRISSGLVAAGVNTSLAGAAGNSTAVVLQSLGTNYEEGLQQGLPERDAASRAWTKTLAEVPANAVAGATMGLRLGPNAWTNVLGQTGVQGAGGGTGAAMASAAVGEEADPVEIALEILGEGISAGPELAGLTYARIAESRTVQRAEAAALATADAEHLGTLVQAADASALKARDAETFADLVEHLQPDTVLYVEPQHLAGIDLSAVPAVAVQAAEAAQVGGDVQIRLSDLLAHLPGEQLLPHLRTSPEALTAAEAQGFDGMAELQDELTASPALPESPVSEQAMTPADWEAYMAEASDATQRAIEVRDARSMRNLRWLDSAHGTALREIRAQAAAVRGEVEAQAAAEVAQQPAYAAQHYMAAQPDAHPEVVAEMFGYSSAEAMQDDIRGTEPEAMAVEARTDALMAELHPDLTDEIGRARQAQTLVAGRARTRALATEAAALANALGSRAQLERDAGRYAEQSIARRAVRAIRPAQFEAAAERAGRRASMAFRRGDTAGTAKAKREQAFQSALQAQAETTTAEIERALQGFRRMVHKADDGSRDGNLADAARAVLAQYGLARVDQTAADYLAKVQHYDPDLHADLLALADGLPAPGNYRDLTVADFRTVQERVEALWALARTTRQHEIDGQMVEIAASAQTLAEQLAGERQMKREQQVGTNDRLDLRMRLAGVRAALRRVEHWSDARDRGDSNGPFRRLIWQPVSEAVTRYRAQRNEWVNGFLKLLRTIEPTLKPGKIAAPELGDGMVFADRSALLHALLHTGNESNRRKLLLGYGWGALHEDGSLDSTRWDRFLKRMHDEGRITAADWQFVQATWDLLEQTKAHAQKAHKRMFGFHFAEVTADPVQTPFGELRGGYVPAVTDSLLVPEARSHSAMDDMLAGQTSPMFPAVNRGFTKGRIETYARPLALDLRMLPAHIDKVARFATLGPVLRDTARLVTRNRAFRAAMDAVDPTAIESMLVPWLKRTATQSLNKPPESQADRAVSRVANTVRNRTGLILMAGNVVNTLQQITGVSVAALRVGPRYLGAGLMEFLRAPRATAEAISTLSPWMRQRADEGARDVDKAIERMLTNPSLRERAEQASTRYGYALQQTAQNLIDRVVWLGAYKKAEALEADSTQAVRYADGVVRMTQGSFAPEDASRVEHATAFTRLFLQFTSYFNSQGNLLATEVQHALRLGTSRERAERLAVVYLLGFAVPAFLADLISKGMRGELGDDDEDGDELAQQLLESFAVSQARYALAMVPIVGQAGNAAIGQFTPERFDDRIGASPAFSAVEATIRAPRSIYRAATGEGNPRTAVRDGLTAVQLLTGIPTGVLVRPLGHLADEDADVSVRGLITGVDPER